jgi:4-amino-4-deoxy-L-arabinose transferase-like glycosyltransferase
MWPPDAFAEDEPGASRPVAPAVRPPWETAEGPPVAPVPVDVRIADADPAPARPRPGRRRRERPGGPPRVTDRASRSQPPGGQPYRADGQPESPEDQRPGGRIAGALAGSWPVALILAVQALLSVRLVRADTAFQDEAAYLWAGHLELAHWLHGVSIPPFPAYFSGAPVLYPPLGALADQAGGLAAARTLSLVFMLGATAFLAATATRLFGRRAGAFAGALFAIAGPTLHLGAFATFDAPSLLLTSIAVWLVVKAGERADATAWMVGAGAILALANAMAYSSAVLDPVVVLLALVTACPRPGGRAAAIRALTLLAATALLLTAGVLLGGSRYATGILGTTLARVGGTDSLGTIATDAGGWIGIITVVALCGVAISAARREPASRTWLLALLAVAALVVPAEQARLHTTASLAKHVTVGCWFAAIAAGYAVDWLVSNAPAGRLRVLTGAAVVVALVFPLTVGATQARALATAWPSSYSLNAILGPLARSAGGRLLVEDPSIAEYYLPAGRDWKRWSSTRNITLPSGASTGGPAPGAGVTGDGNAGVFAEFITEGYFSVIALNFADTTALDHKIAAEVRRNHHYHLVQVIPYGTGTYVIWRYEPKP